MGISLSNWNFGGKIRKLSTVMGAGTAGAKVDSDRRMCVLCCSVAQQTLNEAMSGEYWDTGHLQPFLIQVIGRTDFFFDYC